MVENEEMYSLISLQSLRKESTMSLLSSAPYVYLPQKIVYVRLGKLAFGSLQFGSFMLVFAIDCDVRNSSSQKFVSGD